MYWSSWSGFHIKFADTPESHDWLSCEWSWMGGMSVQWHSIVCPFVKRTLQSGLLCWWSFLIFLHIANTRRCALSQYIPYHIYSSHRCTQSGTCTCVFKSKKNNMSKPITTNPLSPFRTLWTGAIRKVFKAPSKTVVELRLLYLWFFLLMKIYLVIHDATHTN